MTSEIILKKLLEEFQKRKYSNPRYSLRAYARDLGISASILSRILSRSIPISQSFIQRVQYKLFKNDRDFDDFTTTCFQDPDFLKNNKKLMAKDFEIFRLWYFWSALQLQKTHPEFSLDSLSHLLNINKTEAGKIIQWIDLIRNKYPHVSEEYILKSVEDSIFEDRFIQILLNLPQDHLTSVKPYVSQKTYPLALNHKLAKAIEEKTLIYIREIIDLVENDHSPKDQLCEVMISILPFISAKTTNEIPIQK